MESSTMAKVVLYALLSALTVGAECLLPGILIDSQNVEGMTGCYNKTRYSGVYSTTVWTLEGVDIAPGGTSSIVADVVNGTSTSNAEPMWSIGAVVANPGNTWSDGYSSGLVVTTLVCAGTSPFWNLNDPTEETQWKCDSNNDGTLTVGESDLTVTCGCHDQSLTPTPSTVALVSPTPAPVGSSQSPVLAASRSPLAATVEPTTASTSGGLETTRNITATPTPFQGDFIAPITVSCNLTLASETLSSVAGCYVGSVSSNTRGRWLKPDRSASIEWKDPQDSDVSTSGSWVIQLSGSGGPDVTKCFSNQDEDDPTTLDTTDWICDDDLDGTFAARERGDFDGLECRKETCDASTIIESAQEDTGGGGGSATAIIAGTLVGGGVLVAGLILVGVFVVKRRRNNRTKEVEPMTDKDVPTDPNAPPAPVPVFEPWGTRPPPTYYV